MKPCVPILLALLFLSPAAARAAEAFRVYESTAASVNGEVLFVSDVAREACLLGCAAMPGTGKEILSPVRRGIAWSSKRWRSRSSKSSFSGWWTT